MYNNNSTQIEQPYSPKNKVVPQPYRYKPLFYIFFFLFFLTLSSSLFLINQKSNKQITSTFLPTSINQKTYTDKKYGISFNYPNNFNTDSLTSNANHITNVQQNNCPSGSMLCPNLDIYYYNSFQDFLNSNEIKSRTNKTGKTLKDWIDSDFTTDFYDLKKIKIDKNEAYLFGHIGSAIGKNCEILFSKNQHIYQLILVFIGDDTNTCDVNPTFNPILSTIKINL